MDLTLYYKKEWFLDIQSPKLLMKLYSSVGITEDLIIHYFNREYQEQLFDNYGVIVTCGFVEDFEYSISKTFSGSFKDGTQQTFLVQVKNLILPSANYVILSSAIETSGEARIKDETDNNLTTVAAILRLQAGNNFLKDLVFDFEVDVNSGEVLTHSDIKMIPDNIQGPHLDCSAVDDMKKIAYSISQVENRKKYELALRELEYASQITIYQKIIYYWIAIDSLLPCGNGAIYQKFYNIYKHEVMHNKNYINDVLGINKAKKARNDYQHKGIKYALVENQERYLQMLFLDLIKHELKLPFKRHLANFIETTQFDIFSFNKDMLNVAQIKVS